MSFHVRNYFTKRLLGLDGYAYARKPGTDVVSFETADEALRNVELAAQKRQAVEVTYGLRWYTRQGAVGVPRDYLTRPAARIAFHPDRKEAHRFPTAAAARAYAEPSTLAFRDGPEDVTGLRVVRFTRVVKP